MSVVEHADIRHAMGQLFEQGAVAIRGRGSYTKDGTTYPATVRVVSTGPSPRYLVEITAEHDGSALDGAIVYALDGVCAYIAERGILPAAWLIDQR